MKKYLSINFLLIIALLALTSNADAQSKRTIQLKDGSILRGELLQLKNGTYTIKTKNLGTFELPESKISNISDANQGFNQNNQAQRPNPPEAFQNIMSRNNPRTNNMPVPYQNAQSLKQGIASTMNKMPPEAKAMQGMLLSDPDLMKDIQNLASDPEISSLLSDPDLMKAVISGNMNSIGNNSKAQSLMQNPKVKQIINKLGNKMNHQ